MGILEAIEASIFAMWVKESSTAYVAVLAFHTIGLAFLVGISGATALRILGVARSMPIEPLEDFFPLMYAGFWMNAFTGSILLVLYPTDYLFDPSFYIKICAVIIAVVSIRKLQNLLFRNDAALETILENGTAKLLSTTILITWLIAVVTGRVMAYSVPTKLQTAAAVLCLLIIGVAIKFISVRLGWIKAPTAKIEVHP